MQIAFCDYSCALQSEFCFKCFLIDMARWRFLPHSHFVFLLNVFAVYSDYSLLQKFVCGYLHGSSLRPLCRHMEDDHQALPQLRLLCMTSSFTIHLPPPPLSRGQLLSSALAWATWPGMHALALSHCLHTEDDCHAPSLLRPLSHACIPAHSSRVLTQKTATPSLAWPPALGYPHHLLNQALL